MNKVLSNKSIYILKEMDGIPIDRIYLRTHFKKFVKRKGEYIPIKDKEDIGNIIEDEFKNSLKVLLNLKRSKRIA